jgi:hypothetical protein
MVEATQSPRLQRFLPHWAQSAHPIYRREMDKWERSRGVRPLRMGCAPLAVLIFVALGCMCGLIVDPTLEPVDRLVVGSWIVLGALFMGQGLVSLATGLTATALSATLISGELESETFSLLRVTGVPTNEIILAKYAASLRQLVIPVAAIIGARFLLLLGTLAAIDISTRAQGIERGLLGIVSDIPLELVSPFSVAAVLVPGLAWLGYFVFKPALSMMMFSSVGLFASSTARTRANGLITAILMRVALFVLRFISDQTLGIGGQFVIGAGSAINNVSSFFEALIVNRPALAVVLGGLTALVSLLVALLWRGAVTFLLVRGTVRRAYKLPYE